MYNWVTTDIMPNRAININIFNLLEVHETASEYEDRFMASAWRRFYGYRDSVNEHNLTRLDDKTFLRVIYIKLAGYSQEENHRSVPYPLEIFLRMIRKTHYLKELAKHRIVNYANIFKMTTATKWRLAG